MGNKSKKKRKYSIAYQIVRGLFTLGYLASLVVLIVEAATPGKNSAIKSNAVGATIENIINDINGDTAKEVMPKSCSITNSKTTYDVGDKVDLVVETYPSDATYKSYKYKIDHETSLGMVSISASGEVSFLKAGEVTISVINSRVESVKASITFRANNVDLISFNSSIPDADKEDDVYILKTSNIYYVENTFSPANATIKDVSYEFDESLGYIRMDKDMIKVVKDSNDEIFELKVICQGLTNILRIQTYTELIVEDYPLISIKASDNTLYADQTSSTFTPKVTYNPVYTSEQYLGYHIEIDNPDIAYVSGTYKYKIKGVVGSTSIRVISNYDSNIFTTFTLTVKSRPQLASASITRYSSKMYVDGEQTIGTSYTAGASVSKSFISSNTSVASITSDGKITALSAGYTDITFTVTDKVYGGAISKVVSIEVINAPSDAVIDFEIKYLVSDNPYLKLNEQIDLKDYFAINRFIGNDNPINLDYSFYISSSYGSLSGSKFTPKKVGQFKGTMSYINDGGVALTNTINFYTLSPFEINSDTPTTRNSGYSIYIGEEINFDIELLYIDKDVTQHFEISDKNNLVTLTYGSDWLHVLGQKAGQETIHVSTYIEVEGTKLYGDSYDINIEIKDILTNTLDVNFYDEYGALIPEDTFGGYFLYKDEQMSYEVLLDKLTSKSNISISVSNPQLVKISGNKIIPQSIGDVIFKVKELESGLEKEYPLAIRNHVLVNESSPLTITGIYDYNASASTLSIVNGNSVRVRYNFLSESTYKVTKFESSNNKVFTVGSDGVITPVKVGKATLKLSVSDEFSSHLSTTITVKIVRRNFIQSTAEFFAFIRKLVGHFGAFLVLGIFSTVTYFMFFRKKLFPVGVAINYSTSFGFAALTEYIQTKTPGRAGLFSDVLIDYYGFLTSATLITLSIILIFLSIKLVKYIIKKNKDNQKEVDK